MLHKDDSFSNPILYSAFRSDLLVLSSFWHVVGFQKIEKQSKMISESQEYQKYRINQPVGTFSVRSESGAPQPIMNRSTKLIFDGLCFVSETFRTLKIYELMHLAFSIL